MAGDPTATPSDSHGTIGTFEWWEREPHRLYRALAFLHLRSPSLNSVEQGTARHLDSGQPRTSLCCSMQLRGQQGIGETGEEFIRQLPTADFKRNEVASCGIPACERCMVGKMQLLRRRRHSRWYQALIRLSFGSLPVSSQSMMADVRMTYPKTRPKRICTASALPGSRLAQASAAMIT